MMRILAEISFTAERRENGVYAEISSAEPLCTLVLRGEFICHTFYPQDPLENATLFGLCIHTIPEP